MNIIEFKQLSPDLKNLVASSLIKTNKLKPDVNALIKFISNNKLYCVIEDNKLLACSGYKNLRGIIRLSIIKNYLGENSDFINRVKTFSVKEKGWTYRDESCPKEVLDIINKTVDKQLGYYKLYSLVEKSNERMIKSSITRGFIKVMEMKSPTSDNTLIVLYRK